MKQASFEAVSHIAFGAILALLAYSLKMPDIFGPMSEERLWDSIGEMWPSVMACIASFAFVGNFWRSYQLLHKPQPVLDAKSFVAHMLFVFLVSGLLFTTQLLGTFSAMQVAVFMYAMNIACISLSLAVVKLYTERVPLKPSADTMAPFAWAIVALFFNIQNPALALVILVIASIIRLAELDTAFAKAVMPYVRLNKAVLGKK